MVKISKVVPLFVMVQSLVFADSLIEDKQLDIVKPEQAYSAQGSKLFFEAGISSLKSLSVDKESGSVELDTMSYRLGYQVRKDISDRSFALAVGLGMMTAELDYDNGLGVLEVGDDFMYGLEASVSLKTTDKYRLSLFAGGEFSSLKGSDFKDRLNSRANVPFEADVDYQELQIGLSYENAIAGLTGFVFLESRLFYSEVTADMSPGWYISDSVSMEKDGKVGLSGKLTFCNWNPIQPYFKLAYHDSYAAALGFDYTFK